MSVAGKTRHWDLRGRVVFVTGAASGIGQATAQELVRRGARLLLLDIDSQALHGIASRMGASVVAVGGDVTSTVDVERAVGVALERFGCIDVVWSNAGVASFGPLAITDAQAWRRCLEVNLLGSFTAIHAALPLVMERKGMVAVTASAATFAHSPGLSAYCASKAALEAMCNALRIEMASHGVGVLAIYPSWIATPLLDRVAPVTAFAALRTALPWPLGSTATTGPLAVRIADAMQQRRSRLHSPRWVAALAALRPLLHQRPFEWPLRRAAPDIEAAFRRDIATLGRAVASNGSSPGALERPLSPGSP